MKDQRELQLTALSATLLAQVTEIYVVDQKASTVLMIHMAVSIIQFI